MKREHTPLTCTELKRCREDGKSSGHMNGVLLLRLRDLPVAPAGDVGIGEVEGGKAPIRYRRGVVELRHFRATIRTESAIHSARSTVGSASNSRPLGTSGTLAPLRNAGGSPRSAKGKSSATGHLQVVVRIVHDYRRSGGPETRIGTVETRLDEPLNGKTLTLQSVCDDPKVSTVDGALSLTVGGWIQADRVASMKAPLEGVVGWWPCTISHRTPRRFQARAIPRHR
jgi:hypothetical protein